MSSRVTQVLDLFADKYNCCQAMLATYGEIHGLNCETALKLGSGMGSGLGRVGGMCGFVSATCLLLGLKHGTDAPDAKLKVNPICLEFCNDFKAKYGSVHCIDIIKRKICAECGQFVAELLENKYDILTRQQ